MSLPQNYLAIDEEGFPLSGEVRITDPVAGREILSHIEFAENGALQSTFGGAAVFIEAFDEPYVAQSISKNKITLPYEFEIEIDLTSLTVDEWDRFHGYTTKGIPFVLSRKAQAGFFNQLQEFDDESITLDGQRIETKAWLKPEPEVRKEKYWSQIYQTENPRWELEQPAPALKDMLPRLKLAKSRVLILGCGSGNDAALFAEQGHVVTAVDISDEALQRAKAKYSQYKNIHWIQSDIFNLGQEHLQAYDVIFEHTCFCAIDPSRRNELIQIWKRSLAPGGFLLAVLFVMDRKHEPPFGGSEWEYRERLKKHFQFLFWGRLKNSIERRNGKELLIYAVKR